MALAAANANKCGRGHNPAFALPTRHSQAESGLPCPLSAVVIFKTGPRASPSPAATLTSAGTGCSPSESTRWSRATLPSPRPDTANSGLSTAHAKTMRPPRYPGIKKAPYAIHDFQIGMRIEAPETSPRCPSSCARVGLHPTDYSSAAGYWRFGVIYAIQCVSSSSCGVFGCCGVRRLDDPGGGYRIHRLD